MKRFLLLIILFLLVVPNVNGGANNCKPAWKCPTPSPTITPRPTPTTRPTSTLSSLPPQPPAMVQGEWRKNFLDGTLAPLKVRTWPDDHIGQPGNYMSVYNRYSNGARQVSVHDGYAELKATLRTDGLWDAVLLATSQDGDGPVFGLGRYEFMLRANVAYSTWQAVWLLTTGGTEGWTAYEIDWPEMLEGLNVADHVLGLGVNNNSRYSPPPADWKDVWHLFWIEKYADRVVFGIDGTEWHRVLVAQPSLKQAILMDSKVGFQWEGPPDSRTPNPTWLQVAWVRFIPY